MYESKQFLEQPIKITQLHEIQSNNSIGHLDIFKDSPPSENESVYAYACRLLQLNLGTSGINFDERILALSQQKSPLRILSLCSGSARNEARLDEVTDNSCHWTLQDLNENLLTKARRQFSPAASVEFLVGDINKIGEMGKEWDIIMCVSGLHHVVELERVVSFISQSLAKDGEFWLIGEYVGKSGNRLHHAAQMEADRIFSTLPPKYRFNQHLNSIDMYLPRNDYSIDCFEGIRADEIEPIIASQFYPKHIDKNNSFLWRLVNLAYADNYDLRDEKDLKILHSLIFAEITHFKKHFDGTTLNAVYAKLN
jgi:SAM-dependent methyltransferase